MPNQKGVTLWFTGLSGSGKTTIAKEVQKTLKAQGYKVERLDGDEIRENLCRDLTFSKKDRDENIRRVSYLAKLLTRNDIITLCCFVSPYREARAKARASIGSFVEVFVDAPLALCEERDVKGHYARAKEGGISNFTGLDDPYEAPENPELHLTTAQMTVRQCADIILEYMSKHGYLLS